MLIDFLSGFFDLEFEGENRAKLGIFGKALGAGVAGGGAVDNTPLPAMEKPKRVSKVNNPSFATITSQLEDLIKTANKIGVYTKEQQEAILNQISQAKRVAKEQQLENKPPAVPELPDATSSNDLGPLDTSVNALIVKIDQLSETVDGLINGGMGTSGAPGMPLDISRGRRGRRPAPARVVRSNTSPTGYRYAAGTGRGGQYAKAPSWLGRATAAVSSGTRTAASRVAAPIATGAASSRVAGLMSSGLRNARRVGGPIKAAVRRAAGPIIGKALGRTVLKSIPLVGAGIGAAFAVSRLLQGDVLGAGIELASGVAGPLTAVPALAASVARDTYANVYGVQPEQDPNFSERYKELKGEIDQMIKEQLTGAVKPKATPTDREIGERETPARSPQAAPMAAPPPVPPVTSPVGASGNPPAPDAAAANSPAPAAAAAADASRSSTTSSAGAPQPIESNTNTGLTLANPVMETNANALSGATLSAQQIPVDSAYQNYGYSPTTGTFTPQTGTTTRGAAQGVGNIPSPIYSAPGLEAFKSTLFFGV